MHVLVLLMVAHFFVDLVGTVISPLWPLFETHASGGKWAVFWLPLIWSIATSFTQLVFGLWGDQRHIPWIIWAGPAAAALCLSFIGLSDSTGMLVGLTVFAGLGIAAFHPEAASMAGNSLPFQRSRAMSLFQFSGFLGQTAGPYYSGVIVERWGLKGLFPGLIWLLIVTLLLRIPLRRFHPEGRVAPATPIGLRVLLAGRWRALGLLLAIGVTRIIPASGIPLALAFLSSVRDATTSEIGLLQSAFLFGLGGGGLLCALGVRPRAERMIMWLLPLLSAPAIVLLPHVSGGALLACAVVAGVLLGSALPVFIGIGQQLLPHSQRVGSSITMGLSWGAGGALAAVLTMGLQRVERIEQAFPVFAVAAVASSVLCFFLPATQEHAPGESSAAPSPAVQEHEVQANEALGHH